MAADYYPKPTIELASMGSEEYTKFCDGGKKSKTASKGGIEEFGRRLKSFGVKTFAGDALEKWKKSDPR